MKVCPIVDVGMHLKNCPPMSLKLYVVPTICEPLVSQPITACFEQNPKFMGLDIACGVTLFRMHCSDCQEAA